MFFDISQMIFKELEDINKIIKTIEESYLSDNRKSGNGQGSCVQGGIVSLHERCTSEGEYMMNESNVQTNIIPGGWPDGDKQDGEKQNGEKQEKPEDMPDLKGETITLSDISEGDIVTITLDENGKTVSVKVMGGAGGFPSQGGQPESNDSAA